MPSSRPVPTMHSLVAEGEETWEETEPSNVLSEAEESWYEEDDLDARSREVEDISMEAFEH